MVVDLQLRLGLTSNGCECALPGSLESTVRPTLRDTSGLIIIFATDQTYGARLVNGESITKFWSSYSLDSGN